MRRKKIVEINNFNNNNGVALVKGFYNCKPSKTLKGSHGIKNATFPKNLANLSEKELKISATGIEKVKGVTYFKQYYAELNKTIHRLLVYGSDKKIYINQLVDDTYDLFWLYGLQVNSPPISLMYKQDDLDYMIIASVDTMYVWKVGYSPYKVEDVPIITSMCMHEGVLFCTVKDPAFKVWYALDLSADRIGHISNTSGYISLDDDLGDAKKVVVFNQDVYVFRDYGISKINYLKEEITVSQIYKTNTKLYCNTISVCGNAILFMTKEGLYSFNGIKVAKLDIQFFSDFDVKNDAAVASSLGEKYYLALRYDFNDGKQILCENEEYKNNVLVVVDTSDMSNEVIRGVDIASFAPVQTDVFEKMLVTFNSGYVDKIGEISKNSICIEENLPKFWESSNLVDNFNTKLITKLAVNSGKDVKFTLLLDNEKMEFVTYTSGLNEFSFKTCAKDVKLQISSETENTDVKKVIIEYYEY